MVWNRKLSIPRILPFFNYRKIVFVSVYLTMLSQNLDYIALTACNGDEQWTEEDVEGSGHGLI
jgi:hypothetical protein